MARLKKPTSCQDLADDPRHVLKWLRSKPPRSVVTRDMLSNESCLFANLAKFHGFEVDIDPFVPCDLTWTGHVINSLPIATRITAKAAIAAVEKAISA